MNELEKFKARWTDRMEDVADLSDEDNSVILESTAERILQQAIDELAGAVPYGTTSRVENKHGVLSKIKCPVHEELNNNLRKLNEEDGKQFFEQIRELDKVLKEEK